jgi:hypothetical protein
LVTTVQWLITQDAFLNGDGREFECRAFFASDRKGDGTDCHEITSFLVVMTAFTMDMAVL